MAISTLRSDEFQTFDTAMGTSPSAILNVGPDETYATIADAMGVANTGDQILLEAGYGNENALVTVNNLFVNGISSSMNVDLTLGAGIGTVTLLGTAPIDVFDNSGNDTITGNNGNNFIEVTGGIDVAHGGNGTDRLYVDYTNATSAIIGTAVNITDGGGHAVTFDGFENFSIYTGSGDDTITSNDGQNTIDTGSGNDTITSGNGQNTIDSGPGNDTVTIGDGGNRIWGGYGNDTITAGTGNDYINGGLGDDTLTGGGGNDALDGSKGNDTVSGGAGDDDLIGGKGFNILDGGADTDTADYSTSTMAVNVTLALATAQAVNSVETDTLTNIENLTGSAHNDTLTGDGGANVLDGGAGVDILSGGAGDDTYLVDNAADIVNEAVGGGNDTVLANVDYALGAGQEIETLKANAGATGLILTGNEFANTVMGGDGDDTLNGLGGNDTLRGGDGNDTLNGGDGLDTLNGAGGADQLTGGAGNDTFYYGALSDSTNLAPDTIFDLTNNDRINLAAIDADTTVSGDQAFHVVGAFTDHPGELVLSYSGGMTTLTADVNGDGVADMTILIAGDHHTFTHFVF